MKNAAKALDGPEDRAAACDALRFAWERYGAPSHAGWRWWRGD